MARFERGHSIAATVLHPASHSSCSPSCIPYSFGREREREQWRKFHSITRGGGGGADSDQCRPRGWHHQLQIAPPPLTPPRTLALQPVIAPARAANNRGGRRRDSELGKGAQLVPFPSLFSKFDNAVADRSHFHNWARCSFPAVPLCSETLLGRSAVLLPSLKHCGHGADTRPAIWNRGCVIPSMPP